MSLYKNPEGLIGYNELSPYVQRLLKDKGVEGYYVHVARSYQQITKTVLKVEVNIDSFDKNRDELLVFKNGLFMTLDLEYTLNADNTITPIDEVWNGTSAKPIIFDFVALCNAKKQESGGGGSNIEFVKTIISTSDWIQEGDMYYKLITHNLNSESLILSAIDNDTKKSLQEIYTIIDSNNLKLYNDSKINLALMIVDVTSATGGSTSGGSSSGGGNSKGATITVSSSEFVYDSSNDMYKATVSHGVGSEDILIGAVGSDKKSVHTVYDVVDENTITLYNTIQDTLKLSILSL